MSVKFNFLPQCELLLLAEELLLTETTDMLPEATVGVCLLLPGDGDGEEEGCKKEAFVVGVEVLDNDEEKLLVKAAFDSSPTGLSKIGATVSASKEETDERAGGSLWLILWA